MISEFDLLSEKVERLANLTYSLSKENENLRITNTELKRDNQQLQERMSVASKRISALLNTIPTLDDDKEKESEE